MDFVAQTPQFFAEECYAARRLNGFRQQAMIRYGSGNRSADLIWYNSSQSCKNQFLARHYSLLVSHERRLIRTWNTSIVYPGSSQGRRPAKRLPQIS